MCLEFSGIKHLLEFSTVINVKYCQNNCCGFWLKRENLDPKVLNRPTIKYKNLTHYNTSFVGAEL